MLPETVAAGDDRGWPPQRQCSLVARRAGKRNGNARRDGPRSPLRAPVRSGGPVRRTEAKCSSVRLYPPTSIFVTEEPMNAQQPEVDRRIDEALHKTTGIGTHDSQDWSITIPPGHHALITHHFSGASRKHVHIEIDGHPDNEDNRFYDTCEDGRRICLVINNYDLTDTRATFTPGFYAQPCSQARGAAPTPGIQSLPVSATADGIVFYYFVAIDPIDPNVPDKVGIAIVVEEGILIADCP
jgi:hypothetical protein